MRPINAILAACVLLAFLGVFARCAEVPTSFSNGPMRYHDTGR